MALRPPRHSRNDAPGSTDAIPDALQCDLVVCGVPPRSVTQRRPHGTAGQLGHPMVRESLPDAPSARARTVVWFVPPDPGPEIRGHLRDFRAVDVSSTLLLALGDAARPVLPTVDALRLGVDHIFRTSSAGQRLEVLSMAEVWRRHSLPPPLLQHSACLSAGDESATIVLRCLRNAFRPLRSRMIASQFGMSSRTLTRRLRGTPWRAPRALLHAARALHIALLFEREQATAEHIAERLGYADAASVSRRVQRYFGEPLSRLRRGGSLLSDCRGNASGLAPLFRQEL